MEQTIRITKKDIKNIVKEAIDGMLNTDTENNTFGGDPKVDAAIECMESWEWEVDQVNGNIIYGHLKNEPGLEVVVEVRSFDACIRELHYKGDEFDNAYCIDIQYLVDKLAELGL